METSQDRSVPCTYTWKSKKTIHSRYLYTQISLFFKIWLNYKLHPLSLVKVQFNPLSFDHFNSVL